MSVIVTSDGEGPRTGAVGLINPGVPALSFFDPPEITIQVEVRSEYEMWRRWRYQHISVEFEAATWEFAAREWARKRPWWLNY